MTFRAIADHVQSQIEAYKALNQAYTNEPAAPIAATRRPVNDTSSSFIATSPISTMMTTE